MKVDILERFKNYRDPAVIEEYKNMNNGQKAVIDAYIYMDRSKDSLVDLIVINDVWSDEIQQIIDYLKELNIKSFVFAVTSTECFKSIQILLANNCKLSNIDYKIENLFGNSYTKRISGILVEI